MDLFLISFHGLYISSSKKFDNNLLPQACIGKLVKTVYVNRLEILLNGNISITENSRFAIILDSEAETIIGHLSYTIEGNYLKLNPAKFHVNSRLNIEGFDIVLREIDGTELKSILSFTKYLDLEISLSSETDTKGTTRIANPMVPVE